jgi:hypothetical protein
VSAVQTEQLPPLSLADRVRVRTAILTAQRVATLWSVASQETDASAIAISNQATVLEENLQYLMRRAKVPIEKIPVDEVPRAYIIQHILEMAELALKGEVQLYREFAEQAGEWWQIYPRPEYCLREFLIKWTAQEALYSALLWQSYPPLPNDEHYIEADDLNRYLHWHESAPAGEAMLAYTLVFEGDESGFDVDRRREFWCWWLAWAIPAACQLEG